MKAYRYFFAAAIFAAVMGSCADDNDNLRGGNGAVNLRASIVSDTPTLSRTASEDLADIYGDSFKLWISNSKGLVRKYEGLNNLPAESVSLLSGAYVAEAWAGDSVSASWDQKWFKGYQEFTIAKDEVTDVTINCQIANVVVAVEYDDDVKAVLGDDISLKVWHSRGSLTYEGYDVDGKNAYFMMPSNDNDLQWTLQGTKKSDGVTLFTRTSKVADVKSAHRYVFHVKCTPDAEGELGGGYGLNISIDDTEIYQEESVTVAVAPVILASGFDINSPYYSSPGEMEPINVYIFGSSALTSVVFQSDKLPAVLGIADATDLDFVKMSDSFRAELSAKGLVSKYTVDENDGSSRMKITLDQTFVDNMTVKGVYEFNITASDAMERSSQKILTIDLTGRPVTQTEPDTSLDKLTTTSAEVGGTVNSVEDGATIYVDYREEDAASRANDWTTVEATVNGSSYTAKLTGLTPGTTYEWRTRVGDYTSTVSTVTTGAAPQLPNAGFEDWQTESTPFLVYAKGGEMFWDTGNHGSATMSKNVTEPESTVKHSGNYSIALKSQFVGIGIVGKFAAGNVFIGEYLDTKGTDGVIGFGRPFNGRPTKLRGYIRYEPGVVAYTNAGAPDIVKGQPDLGIIYMGLLDETLSDYNGKKYPCIVKTKTAEFFDPEGANVIANGQMVFSEATPGTGMVEFEIPFNYRNTTKIPSYILLTASASKGGDYFSGGPSTMYLDDLELVYE